MNTDMLLYVISFILALLAAGSVPMGRLSPGWLAFALFVLAQII